jgi:hypothetical protein
MQGRLEPVRIHAGKLYFRDYLHSCDLMQLVLSKGTIKATIQIAYTFHSSDQVWPEREQTYPTVRF